MLRAQVAQDEAVVLDGGRQHTAGQLQGGSSMERKASAASAGGSRRSVQMVAQ